MALVCVGARTEIAAEIIRDVGRNPANQSAEGFDLLSTVAVSPNLGVDGGEDDLTALKENQKVLIVEGWVHHRVSC
jgi:hypothetical protein